MKKKLWHPDPRIERLIKPFFYQGYSALAASNKLIRDEQNNIVKNPNIKTYIKYWRYWKEEFTKKFQKHVEAVAWLKIKEFEEHYLPAYNELILLTNEMLEVLESYRGSGQNSFHINSQDCVFDDSIEKIPDVQLENLILIMFKHYAEVLETKFQTENDILLLKFNKRKLDRRLYKITIKTHLKQLRVVNYLSKRETKQIVLHCQVQDKMERKIIIRCGICATKILRILIHKMQAC